MELSYGNPQASATAAVRSYPASGATPQTRSSLPVLQSCSRASLPVQNRDRSHSGPPAGPGPKEPPGSVRPGVGRPSWRQTTSAAALSNCLEATAVPHNPLTASSSRPELLLVPLTRRTLTVYGQVVGEAQSVGLARAAQGWDGHAQTFSNPQRSDMRPGCKYSPSHPQLQASPVALQAMPTSFEWPGQEPSPQALCMQPSNFCSSPRQNTLFSQIGCAALPARQVDGACCGALKCPSNSARGGPHSMPAACTMRLQNQAPRSQQRRSAGPCLPAPKTAPRIASAGVGRPSWRHTTAAAAPLKLHPYWSEQTCMPADQPEE